MRRRERGGRRRRSEAGRRRGKGLAEEIRGRESSRAIGQDTYIHPHHVRSLDYVGEHKSPTISSLLPPFLRLSSMSAPTSMESSSTHQSLFLLASTLVFEPLAELGFK